MVWQDEQGGRGRGLWRRELPEAGEEAEIRLR